MESTAYFWRSASLTHPFGTLIIMTKKHLTASAEQLPLLDSSHVPVKLRLDERTRRLGLSQVQVMRAILDDQIRRAHARDEADTEVPARRLAA